MATQTATLQQHSEKFEAMASTDARVARLEELVTSMTTTRSGLESAVPTPITTRTPQVQRNPVRRSLLSTDPATTTSRSIPTSTPLITPPLITEAERAEVKKYEMKDVLKLMRNHLLKSLRYDDWLRFLSSIDFSTIRMQCA